MRVVTLIPVVTVKMMAGARPLLPSPAAGIATVR
jgi:hypothetical protein